MANYRIQKRKMSADVIEKRCFADNGKEYWKVIIAPLDGRHSVISENLIKILNKPMID